MADRKHPTDEVASEGGSFGNVEVERDDDEAAGSEASETIRQVDRRKRTVVRGETGERHAVPER